MPNSTSPGSLTVNLAVLALVSGLLIGTIELVSCGVRANSKPGVETEEITPLYGVEDHPDLGYALVSDTQHRAIKGVVNGDTCYDVTYSTDDFRRRTVFQRAAPSNRHLILFGGSVVFGEGLADEDTLQLQLARQMPGRNVYNYAVHGYGPSHMLAQLESGELAGEVESHGGDAVYAMIPSHVSRVIGDTRAFWVYDGPYYSLDAAGRLIRNGSFASGRPATTRLYRRFGALKQNSHFLRLINLELPVSIDSADVELTAEVIIAAAAAYAAQFDGSFHLLFHPTWDLGVDVNADHHRILEDAARRAGISVLDYGGSGLQSGEIIGEGCDPHPNGELNGRLAARVAFDLRSAR